MRDADTDSRPSGPERSVDVLSRAVIIFTWRRENARGTWNAVSIFAFLPRLQTPTSA